MNKLQASMRDRSAKTWKERTTRYKVGSPMKGSANCGDIEEDPDTGRVRYTSGFQVYRAYKPWNTHWTWLCVECGAKDLRCWSPDELGLVEAQLGKEPIVGCRDAVRARKYELRKDAVKMNTKVEVEPSRAARIAELEKRLAELMAKVKGKEN